MQVMKYISKKVLDIRVCAILEEMESLLEKHNTEKDSLLNLYAEQNKKAFQIIAIINEVENSRSTHRLLKTLSLLLPKYK